jgi:hypothetical protein
MSRNVRFLMFGVLVTVVAMIATQIWAQSTTPTSAPASTAAPATEAVIQQIVEITRAVPAGASAVNAFTVPAGSRLVVTDVILTNAGATSTCTISIGRGAQSVTGPLCVSARSSLALPLVTGLEFAAGEILQITRPSDADAGTASTSTGAVSVHMRGFLTAG